MNEKNVLIIGGNYMDISAYQSPLNPVVNFILFALIVVVFIVVSVVNVKCRKWVCANKIVFHGIPFVQLFGLIGMFYFWPF